MGGGKSSAALGKLDSYMRKKLDPVSHLTIIENQSNTLRPEIKIHAGKHAEHCYRGFRCLGRFDFPVAGETKAEINGTTSN